MAQWAYHYPDLLTKLGVQVSNYPVIVQEARTHPNKKGELIRKFYAFQTWSEYKRYEQSLPPNKRNYFESIKGELPQKPHFDIDLDKKKHKYFLFKPEQLIDRLVYAIIHVLAKYGVSIRLDRDILFFTSHDETAGKWSYHLIVDHWCHKNHLEAKQFYQLVMDELPSEYKVEPYVDHMVYSSFQQFRLIDNCKAGTQRFKCFQPIWFYNGNQIRTCLEDEYQIFTHSLVGNTTYCRSLPTMETTNKKQLTKEGQIIENGDLGDILTMVPNDYEFVKQVDNLLIFTRIQKGVEVMCEVCHRTHGNDNPYVLVSNDEVLFFCRRHENNRPKVLGRLNRKPIEQPKRFNMLRKSLLELDAQDSFTKPIKTKTQRLHDTLNRIYHH